MLIKRIVGLPVQYGGIEHTGWLPPGASRPLPTPIQNVLLDVSIEGDPESGYLLIYSAQDRTFSNDDWYDTVAAAEEAAQEKFGISADKWESA